MTSIESYTAVATQARQAAEKSVETFTRGTKSFTEYANLVAKLPTVDLTQPVQRYFEYVQEIVDVNRDLATKWADVVMSLTGSAREQAKMVGHAVTDHADTVAELATEQAKKAEQLAQEQVDAVDEAEKEQARLVRKAEREQAKQDHELAREPYQGLNKSELSDLLAERELPKSGNVDELIERLVAADGA